MDTSVSAGAGAIAACGGSSLGRLMALGRNAWIAPRRGLSLPWCAWRRHLVSRGPNHAENLRLMADPTAAETDSNAAVRLVGQAEKHVFDSLHLRVIFKGAYTVVE